MVAPSKSLIRSAIAGILTIGGGVVLALLAAAVLVIAIKKVVP